MDIVAGIAAATEALKLTKELRNIDKEIDKAELKLRLIELADKLLEAKEALQDAKEERLQLRQKITELETAAIEKSKRQDDEGKLFDLDEHGRRIGKPYCNTCFVRDGKLFRLNTYDEKEYTCPNCQKWIQK